MHKIFKYKLKLEAYQVVRMPHRAKVLHIEMQGDDYCVWALIDVEDQCLADRCFYIAGTGHEFEGKHIQYVTTTQQGPLVWHWFTDIVDGTKYDYNMIDLHSPLENMR